MITNIDYNNSAYSKHTPKEYVKVGFYIKNSNRMAHSVKINKNILVVRRSR